MSTKTAPGFRPMSEFDPALPAMVHDQLNDETFEGSQRSGWSTTDNTPATLGMASSNGTACCWMAGSLYPDGTR